MKVLAAIWAAVIITGTGTVVYVNNAINAAAVESLQGSAYNLQPADVQLQFANTCLQNCNPVQLQPAAPASVLDQRTIKVN